MFVRIWERERERERERKREVCWWFSMLVCPSVCVYVCLSPVCRDDLFLSKLYETIVWIFLKICTLTIWRRAPGLFFLIGSFFFDLYALSLFCSSLKQKFKYEELWRTLILTLKLGCFFTKTMHVLLWLKLFRKVCLVLFGE